MSDLACDSPVPVDIPALRAFHAAYKPGGKGAKEETLDADLRSQGYALGLLDAPRRPATPHKGEKYLLGAKAWFSRLDPAKPVSKPRGVLQTLFYLHGVDVSAARLFTGPAARRFDFFAPQPLALRRISNRPDEGGRDLYQVALSYLRIGDVTAEVEDADGGALGTAQIWLDRFVLALKGDGSAPENPLPSSYADAPVGPRGAAHRYDIAHDPEAQRWEVTANQDAVPIRAATFENLHLADLRLAPDEAAELTARADRLGFGFRHADAPASRAGNAPEKAQVFAQLLKHRLGAAAMQSATTGAAAAAPQPTPAGAEKGEVLLSRQRSVPDP